MASSAASTAVCNLRRPRRTGNVGALGVVVRANGNRGILNIGGGFQDRQGSRDRHLDGTSNTMLVSEDGGRHQVYANGIPVSPNSPGTVGWTECGLGRLQHYVQATGWSCGRKTEAADFATRLAPIMSTRSARSTRAA